MEQPTLVIIKPDGLQKSLTGNILTKLSDAKLVIIGAKMKTVSRELAEAHYHHMKEKPFFEEIVQYLMGEFHTKRTMALVYHGESAIQRVRQICGSTNPEEAAPDTIRGAYGRITTKGVYENVIHASSNAEDSEREIKLWFQPDELVIENLYPTKIVSKSEKVRTWA